MGNKPSQATSHEAIVLEGHVRWLEDQQKKFEQKTEEKEGSQVVNKPALEQAKKKFEEYKEKKDALSYMDAIAAHIALTKETAVGFEKSISKSGTYKKLIELLQDSGLANDAKYGGTVMTLIDLYHEEWSLLHKTCKVMQVFKNKSEDTMQFVDFWKEKLEEGKKISPQEFEKVEKGIRKWFQDEESIGDLHKKWEAFHKKAHTFEQEFKSQKIQDILVKKLQEKCNNHGIKMCAATAGCVGLIALKVLAITGAVAVCGAAATGLLISGAAVIGLAVAGLGYWGYKVYCAKQAAEKELHEAVDVAASVTTDLQEMVNFAAAIKFELGLLETEVEKMKGFENKTVNWKELYLENHNDKAVYKLIKILESISESLKEFGENCERIKNKAIYRQSHYAYGQSA